MLAMTAEDIFDITCIKKQLLPVSHVHQMLNKLFRIQLRKSSWTSSNVAHTILSVLPYVDKEQILPPSITERSTINVKPVTTGDVEMQATDVPSGFSSAFLVKSVTIGDVEMQGKDVRSGSSTTELNIDHLHQEKSCKRKDRPCFGDLFNEKEEFFGFSFRTRSLNRWQQQLRTREDEVTQIMTKRLFRFFCGLTISAL